jgi:hypothetical protein
MGAPYRERQSEGPRLEPDPAARRKVRLAGLTTAALGLGISASAMTLGPLAAAFGGGLALLGLALYKEAPDSPMKASCPACSDVITGIDPRTDVIQCPSCGEHAGVTGETLVAVRHDFVAREPAFAIPIARARRGLPAICAHCGAAGARHVVSLEVSAFGTQVDVDLPVQVVDVPHCEAHDDGATVAPGAVRVRSRALWLEAMALSSAPPQR